MSAFEADYWLSMFYTSINQHYNWELVMYVEFIGDAWCSTINVGVKLINHSMFYN